MYVYERLSTRDYVYMCMCAYACTHVCLCVRTYIHLHLGVHLLLSSGECLADTTAKALPRGQGNGLRVSLNKLEMGIEGWGSEEP